ncbi:MAG: 2-oxoglutarate dehydrogenase complex dihydrolipoyllysine-residue succinyltransferase [Bacteroidetes bacterium]|nr:2-oxoglutarate dehydrogenase complex dihydrolipoyllysine-residue succinyltransferase [Bacteroidota bacterium]
MIIDIKLPQVGESITHVELAKWLVNDGDYIEKDQEIAEIDSDKATLTINAETSGKISIKVAEGSNLEVGSMIGKIDTEALKPERTEIKETEAIKEETSQKPQQEESTKNTETKEHTKPEQEIITHSHITLTPQAQRLLDEHNIKIPNPNSTRITKQDILNAIAKQFSPGQERQEFNFDAMQIENPSREEEVMKMSTIRRKIAERLVSVKNETAMLTTFNEVDMSNILEIRNRNKDSFYNKYGVKLGFMSFFVKAVTESVKHFPLVNGQIKDEEIIVPKYVDVGIAVSTPKGLMVPVIRNAESMSIAQIEVTIAGLAQKARDSKISIEEITGGTFSITNGGVFGSLLATPIINPPQSAILGMHNIVDRPVALNGRVVIKPMMYVALSYDHRIIDGRESVGFLVKVKEFLENPEKMFLGE